MVMGQLCETCELLGPCWLQSPGCDSKRGGGRRGQGKSFQSFDSGAMQILETLRAHLLGALEFDRSYLCIFATVRTTLTCDGSLRLQNYCTHQSSFI